MTRVQVRSMLPPICTTCGTHVVGALTLAVREDLAPETCAICGNMSSHRVAA